MTMKIGFIDYYLDEWHANNYPEWIKEASGGEMEIAYAYADRPSPHTGMTTSEWCEKHGIKEVGTIGELTDLGDGIIVLSPDNCEQHERLCQIPLRSGKPVYVDKTFAPEGANVDFIGMADGRLFVRTYERGVEGETLSCGTGVTAAALVWDLMNGKTFDEVAIRTLGGDFCVSFDRDAEGNYSNVLLEGPATFVFDGEGNF